jgi:ubiquinone/menaquinone biosynthesis C-methylase UbiE
MDDATLKQRVHDYWNAQSCGTDAARSEKFTRAYFDEIEAFRYESEPYIFSFAQFTRYHGQKVLEAGVGAGTDFIQWVRAGAEAHGIDLTEEAIAHVRRRLEVYGLPPAGLRVADVEQLPYDDNSFDLVYSWGVIHHSPNTPRALAELVRVLKPGGELKVMIYNRHSLHTFYRWGRYALLRGKPWMRFAQVLYHHMESEGTKGYTLAEARQMLAPLPLRDIQVRAAVNRYDLLYNKPLPARAAARVLACLLGHDRCGFFLTIRAIKA